MRYLIVAYIMLFWMPATQAQKYELGPYLGGSNFIGDVGATTYIRPNSIAIGGIAKWNRSPRHSWRASLIYTDLRADDAKSNQGRRVERGYSFSNKLLELTLGMEFDFWEYDIYLRDPGVVPYLSTGISTILTHEMFLDEADKVIRTNKRKTGFAIPMIIGAKTRINRTINMGFEIGARMSFYNSLDGSASVEITKNDKPSKSLPFGNTNQFDWYMFTGITLTFAFGENPCYDVY